MGLSFPARKSKRVSSLPAPYLSSLPPEQYSRDTTSSLYILLKYINKTRTEYDHRYHNTGSITLRQKLTTLCLLNRLFIVCSEQRCAARCNCTLCYFTFFFYLAFGQPPISYKPTSYSKSNHYGTYTMNRDYNGECNILAPNSNSRTYSLSHRACI